jgi:uncharacterized protein YqhQ
MSNEVSAPVCRPLSLEPMAVGGQAILEGVMMRSPHSFAIAVRRPNGEIVVKEDAWQSIWERARFLRKPFLRGAVVLFESLHNGMKALTFSANEAAKALEGETCPEAKAEAGEKDSDWAITGALAMSALFGFALFAALPHFLTWLMGRLIGSEDIASGKALSFQVVDGLVKIVFLIGYLWFISRMKEIQRVFQYHGAEHKSIYCYEAGKALTVDNARSFTRLHPRCGTSFLLVTMVVSIVLFSCVFPLLPEFSQTKWLNQLAYVFIKLPLMFPVAGIAYEATRLSARFPDNPVVRAMTWPGLMLQHITTKEPDDQQLEIALVALQKTLWREAHLAAVGSGDEPEVFGDYASFVQQLGDDSAPQPAAA